MAYFRHAHSNAARPSPAGTVAGASSTNARAAASAAACGQTWSQWRANRAPTRGQLCCQSRILARAAVRHARNRRAAASSHTPAPVSAKAAARRSRAGGQPRRQAVTYPAAVTKVSGQATIATTTSSNQRAILTALRSSHRPAVSFSHDQMLIAVAPG